MRKGSSLRRQIITRFLALGFASLAIYLILNGILTFRLLQNEKYQSSYSDQVEVSSGIEEYITNSVNHVFDITDYWLRGNGDPDQLQLLLEVSEEHTELLNRLSVYSPEGVAIRSVGVDGAVIPPGNFDEAERIPFENVYNLESNRVHYFEPYNHGEDLVMQVVMPVTDEGELLGVVTGLVQISTVRDLFQSLDFGENETIHLLSSIGGIIATSDVELQSRTIDYLNIPPVDKLINKESISEFMVYSSPFSGEKMMGSGIILKHLGWLVVSEFRVSGFFMEVLKAQLVQIITAVLALSLATIMGLRIADSISRPVVKLTDRIESMYSGKYQKDEEISGSKEILALAAGLDDMVEQLDLTMQGFENQIGLLEKTESTLVQRSRELEISLEITSNLARIHHVEEQLRYAANTCLDLFDADECCIIYISHEHNIYSTVTRNFALGFQDITRNIGEQFIRSAEPAFFNDLQRNEWMDEFLGGEDMSVHLLSAPLLVAEKQIGEILLIRINNSPFNRAQVNLLDGIAHQVALANDSLRMVELLENYNAVLERAVSKRTDELKAANRDLQELGQLKDDFVSNVSHELRTPLTNLKLRTFLLAQQPDSLPKHLDVLERETERLQSIVENLLMISSFDQDQVSFSMINFNLNKLVAEYTADREMMVQNQNKNFMLDLADDLPNMNGDVMMIGQVLSILLTNAMNYTPAQGEITISTHKREEKNRTDVGFMVKDTGIGIPKEEQEKLFERFYRGKAAGHTGASGTGLGLSIAKQIIDRHGGEIQIKSSGIPGEGASFMVWFPSGL